MRSAKARVPFLARFTGQGVLVGPGNPVIVRFKIAVPSGGHPFEQVWITVLPPGLRGVPKMLPLLVFIFKPEGRGVLGSIPKLVGL